MEEMKINLNDVVESLSMQVKNLSTDCAYNVAIIRQKDKKIQELENDLEQLRKELIEKMDEEVGKEQKK